MIAFEVSVNGKRVCVAGAEDVQALQVNVAASGKLGTKSVLAPWEEGDGIDMSYVAGGLIRTSPPGKDVYAWWDTGTPLKIGDEVTVKIVEVETADAPESRRRLRFRNEAPSAE